MVTLVAPENAMTQKKVAPPNSPQLSTPQLDAWRSSIGDAWFQRTRIDVAKRVPAFREALAGLGVWRILEVGCGVADNLKALLTVDPGFDLHGVEPNHAALRRAWERDSWMHFDVREGTCFSIPYRAEWFDLVFTCGVMMHVRLEDMPRALDEMTRVLKPAGYLLLIEYHTAGETPMRWTERDDLVWARDYRKLVPLLSSMPLTLVREGFWGPEFWFDNCHWWVWTRGG